MTDTPMTCERLDALLSEYLEGTLAAGDRAAVERHARSCARCGALLTDLSSIVLGARTLPDLAPSRDLWSGIETRIEAPVVEMSREAGRGTRRGGAAPVGSGRHWRWPSLAAAAALLVAASSGVTYLAMRHQGASAPETYAVRNDTGIARPTAPAATERVPASGDSNAGPSPTSRAPRPAPRAQLATTATVEDAYDPEIARLEAIVRDRRSQLDTATIAVIERNLRIIDGAIAQSREALAKDPRSRFLNEQLNSALDQKVELLRTVALLPPRT
ncbi:MAG TPA: zf-HC2 domain-containing protein [Gemmatimonadaceae bacterium]|nr:zf-HC2 domain-containing protein [Gemmatimonadaceae bacterium]